MTTDTLYYLAAYKAATKVAKDNSVYRQHANRSYWNAYLSAFGKLP